MSKLKPVSQNNSNSEPKTPIFELIQELIQTSKKGAEYALNQMKKIEGKLRNPSVEFKANVEEFKAFAKIVAVYCGGNDNRIQRDKQKASYQRGTAPLSRKLPQAPSEQTPLEPNAGPSRQR